MAKIARQVLDQSDFATVPLAIAGICAARPPLAVLGSAIGVAGGFALWTLIEYAVHRALHDKRFPRLRALHMRHHQHPTEASGGTVYSTLLIFALVGAAVACPPLAPAVLGLLVGYFAFIALHHAEHHGWDVRIVRGLAEHHDRHHHARPRGCFGVTTSVWDRLFGTL